MPQRKAKAKPKAKAAKKRKAPTKRSNQVQVSKDQRWEAEDDLRTLTRAEEIKSDKKRMSRASAIAKEQVKTASKFAK